jgi:hypothetical protein
MTESLPALIVNVSSSAPAALGISVAVTEHDSSGAMAALQVVVMAKSAACPVTRFVASVGIAVATPPLLVILNVVVAL